MALDAAPEWLTLHLKEPTTSRLLGWRLPRTARMETSSAGPPCWVPGPWASTKVMSAGLMREDSTVRARGPSGRTMGPGARHAASGHNADDAVHGVAGPQRVEGALQDGGVCGFSVAVG